MKNRLIWQIFGILILLMSYVGAASAYNITGTIQNGTLNSANVYVVLMYSGGQSSNSGFGTTITNVPAGGSPTFTIHGVPPGSYQVFAFLDVDGTGSLHINDPANTSASFNLSGDYSIGTLSLAPPTLTLPSSVGKFNVVTTSNGALIVWNGPTSQYGVNGPTAEDADYYVVYWGSSLNPGNGSTAAGSRIVPATGGNYHVFINELAANSSLYFAVQAMNNADGSAYFSPSSSYTIAAQTVGATVSGRVYSSGIAKSASTPLYIALQGLNNGGFYIAEISNPTDTQSWSITGVQPDTYGVFVILDLNNDGFSNEYGYVIGPGMQKGASPYFILLPEVTSVSAPDITLSETNSNTVVTTSNFSNTSYQLQFTASSALKQPVSATVNSGPNITGTIDLGLSLNSSHGAEFGNNNSQVNLSTKPSVGEAYSVTVTYSDGTSETLSPQITGVINNFPKPIFPSGTTSTITSASPFAWQAPNLSSYYDFSLSLNDNSYNQIWSPTNNGSNFPGTQLSVLYNSDNSASQSQLNSGNYTWTIGVNDQFGNQGMNQANFTVQSSGPSISGFTITSGTGGAGSAVTINGSGFSVNGVNGVTAVSFGGVAASSFAFVSDSQITATVPAGAPVGPITVTVGGVTTAGSSFPSLITFTSAVVDATNTVITSPPVTVSVVDSYPAVTTPVSSISGVYEITVPSGVPYSLQIHDGTHQDTITRFLSQTSNFDSSSTPFKLFLNSQLPFSVDNKGLIISPVLNWDSGVPMSGVVLTATSFLHPGTPYTVYYENTSGVMISGTSTYANGIFAVPNVDEGDTVTVTSTYPLYNPQQVSYATHTGVVSEGAVFLTLLPIVAANPPGGSTISTSQPITLSVTNPVGADTYKIWYTTDGSDPTIFGGSRVLYSTPFTFNATGNQTLKFYAVNTTHSVAGAVVPLSYTVYTVPNAPTNVAVIAEGNGWATVSFTPPANNGGSSITSYTVTSIPGGITAVGAGSPITIDNLLSGVQYNFTVTATNAAGSGSISVSMPSPVPNLLVELSPSASLYATLQGAYNAAAAGNTINAQASPFQGNLQCNLPISITLDGGLDSGFLNTIGVTTIQGSLTISQGSLIVKNLILQNM